MLPTQLEQETPKLAPTQLEQATPTALEQATPVVEPTALEQATPTEAPTQLEQEIPKLAPTQLEQATPVVEPTALEQAISLDSISTEVSTEIAASSEINDFNLELANLKVDFLQGINEQGFEPTTRFIVENQKTTEVSQQLKSPVRTSENKNTASTQTITTLASKSQDTTSSNQTTEEQTTIKNGRSEKTLPKTGENPKASSLVSLSGLALVFASLIFFIKNLGGNTSKKRYK
ncbi:MAG: hypothetical protein ACK5NA_11255 [Enterococcus sp.]